MVLTSLTILLVCQLVGEVICHFTEVPIPGPVLDMALLFVVLVARGRIPQDMQTTASGVLHMLGLLFVPAGVGVISYLRLLADEWRPITAALFGSTLLAIVVTGLVVHLLDRHPLEDE